LGGVALALACGGVNANGGGSEDGNTGTGESGEAGTGESGETTTTETTTDWGEPDLPGIPDIPGETCGGDGQPEPGEVCFEHVDLIEDSWFTGRVLVADFDGDGNQDVLQAVEIPCPDKHVDAPAPGSITPVDGSVLTSLRWYPGNGDGTLDEYVEVDTPGWIVSMTVDQVGGYAFMDLGVAMGGQPGTAVVVEGDGQGTLPNPLSAFDTVLPDAISRAAFGQLSNDGWADLVFNGYELPTQIWTNDGTGVFGDPLEVPLPDPALMPAIGDFDGSGREDLALLQHDNNGDVQARVHVYWDVALNGIDAHWESAVVDRGEAVTAGDLDGDGNADLIVADRENALLRVFPGAEGALGDEIAVDTGALRNVAVGHFDGDDRLDVTGLAAYPDDPTLHIVLGDENTLLGPHTEIPEEKERGEFLDAGDLDGDGVDDIVFGDMHALLSNP
jgi:hypothetical protein